MIATLLGIVAWLLRLANTALLIYCIMSFVMPGSDLMRKASAYVEPVLRPFRQLLYRYFPRLCTLPVDFSPLAVWLAIDVVTLLLNLLRRAVI